MHPHTKNAFPFSFPHDNTHRSIVYQQPLPETDLDRVEDMTADAIGRARSAVEALDQLPSNIGKWLEQSLEIVKQKLGIRRILNDEFRVGAEAVLDQLAQLEPEDDEIARLIDVASRGLRSAQETSLRVRDLLGAEAEVRYHRGARRK